MPWAQRNQWLLTNNTPPPQPVLSSHIPALTCCCYRIMANQARFTSMCEFFAGHGSKLRGGAMINLQTG
jgi:hypothetical protein